MADGEYWSDFLRRRVSRRRMLKGGTVAGMGMVAASLVGCGGDSGGTKSSATVATSQGTPAAAGEPKRGGIFNTSPTADPISIDPHTETSSGSMAVTFMAYSKLMKMGPNLDPQLDLAESWKQLDQKTYEFKLRQGVKFHDIAPANGREMVADDVKFSFDRMRTNKAEFKRKHLYEFLDGIETPDKYTVRFTTKIPFGPFINYVANNWAAIVPKEAVEQFGDLKNNAIGTGPFMLKPNTWQRGVGGKLDRNPNYFEKGLPYIDGINLAVIPDASTRLAAFRSKQLDICAPTWEEWETLKKDVPEAVVHTQHGFYQANVGMTSDKKPFNDVRVRNAVALALDRQEVLDKLYQGKGKLNGPIAWGLEKWAIPQDELLKSPGYGKNKTEDIAKAKQLLADAGYPNGFKVTSPTTALYLDLSTIVKDQMKKVGIDVQFEMLDLGATLAKLYAADYEFIAWLGNGYDDPYEWLVQMHSKSSANRFKFSDPKADDLIEKSYMATDEKERQKAVLEAQRYLMTVNPMCWLFSYDIYYVVQPWVKNYKRGASAMTDAYQDTTVWLDKK